MRAPSSLWCPGGEHKRRPHQDARIAGYEVRLHDESFYTLIDRLKGFRTLGTKGEDDAFIPFTEGMADKLTLQLPKGLQVRDKGSSMAETELSFDLSSSVLGLVKRGAVAVRFSLEWTCLVSPTLVLRIQPVRMGSGPAGPTRTGTAWDTLMS